MPSIVLNGITYHRDYKPRFCQLHTCGLRIQFRLTSGGVPESSTKYNKRKGCCNAHSRELQKMKQTTPTGDRPKAVDDFLYGRVRLRSSNPINIRERQTK